MQSVKVPPVSIQICHGVSVIIIRRHMDFRPHGTRDACPDNRHRCWDRFVGQPSRLPGR